MKAPENQPPALSANPPGATPYSGAPKTRILLVDDHPVTRQGLRALLGLYPEFEVCGEADDAALALDMVTKLDPDLAIIDISLKSQNGIELAKNIRIRTPRVRMLMVSMYDEKVYAERALRAGAMGYLMKDEASEKILLAIQTILAGNLYLSPAMQEKMLHRFVNNRKDVAEFSIDTLTDREMEVLQFIGNGVSTREIAKRLNLSTKTIDSYREHLRKKLNLKSGAELTRYAIEYSRNLKI